MAKDHVPSRKRPVHGVRKDSTNTTIVMVTVCTEGRDPWLASDQTHARLRAVWQKADKWAVGSYMIMPDHIHLFCSPRDPECSLSQWVRYWKSCFSRMNPGASARWQRDYWDTRLRAGDSYRDKWEYFRQNPVRKKLVGRPEDWPFQGEMNVLRW